MDLYIAIEKKDVKSVEPLLKNPDFKVNDIIGYGHTPLTLCCVNANDNDVDDCQIIIQIMCLILKHPKCDVNAIDIFGRTALHIICLLACCTELEKSLLFIFSCLR